MHVAASTFTSSTTMESALNTESEQAPTAFDAFLPLDRSLGATDLDPPLANQAVLSSVRTYFPESWLWNIVAIK